jgi:hypothetical protein
MKPVGQLRIYSRNIMRNMPEEDTVRKYKLIKNENNRRN